MNGKVYVRVDHEGRLSRSERATLEEQHAANFIVVFDGDRYLVWKDRYGDPGVVLTKAEADARALDHLDVADGRKKPKEIYAFGRRR